MDLEPGARQEVRCQQPYLCIIRNITYIGVYLYTKQLRPYFCPQSKLLLSIYDPAMATFHRTDSKLLSKISCHTNLILGQEDLKDTDFQVHLLDFAQLL